MALDLLIQEVQDLSEETLIEVVHFVQFLKREKLYPAKSESLAAKRRKLIGKYAGMIRISDDFDAPLDDFKEYM